MKKFKVAILGAGFGERVVLPCIEFVNNMEVNIFTVEIQKKLKIKKI